MQSGGPERMNGKVASGDNLHVLRLPWQALKNNGGTLAGQSPGGVVATLRGLLDRQLPWL